MPISSPSDISDLILYYDCTVSENVTVDASNRVTQVLDTSGNSFHTNVISTTTTSPRYDNGIKLLGQKCVYVTNGSSANWFSIPSLSLSGYSAASIFAMTYATPQNLNGHYFRFSNLGLGSHFGSPNGDWLETFAGSARISMNPYGLPRTYQPLRSVIVRDGNFLSGRVNDTYATPGASTADWTGTPIFLSGFQGFIGEFGIYSRSLTLAEQSDLTDYMAAKYVEDVGGGSSGGSSGGFPLSRLVN